MSDFLTRAGVALSLGVTPQKFAKLRGAELKAKGFPAPAFGSRQGERWDPEAIALWKRSLLPAELRAFAGLGMGGPAEEDRDAMGAELDRRAERLARGELH